MFCKNCGAQVADNVKFCPACGKPTGAAARAGQTSGTSGTPGQNSYQTVPQGNQNYTQMPRTKFRKQFNIGNYILWGGCLLALISLFLKFAEVSVSILGYSQSESTTLFETDDGIFFLAVIIIIAIVNIFKFNIASLVLSCISGALLWYKLSSVNDQLGVYSSMVQYGAGRTLLIIGILIMIGGSIASVVLSANPKKVHGI